MKLEELIKEISHREELVATLLDRIHVNTEVVALELETFQAQLENETSYLAVYPSNLSGDWFRSVIPRRKAFTVGKGEYSKCIYYNSSANRLYYITRKEEKKLVRSKYEIPPL